MPQLTCIVEAKAYPNVRPPIRPKNMKEIRIALDSAERPVVIPVVRPTVPSAEAHSNMEFRIGSPSMEERTMEPASSRKI